MEFKSLLESSTNSQRQYKCMYCSKSYTRSKLVDHIDEKHEDLIPNGYSASRLVFNMINKKDHGTCTVCGKESPWNEDKGRYDRICSNPDCKKKYIKMTEERLMKARGVTKQDLLNDPDFQEKMLENRGISGKYKFQDGTYKTYTGTYEKKFLEFLDVFLHINPVDIYSPGPVVEYEYEGKKHKWITDFYYEPYNLVFDIKDGGDNPNNRSMVHYRAKQIEKEKAIKKLNKYNYIRLTNNNFEQLVLLMMELKELYLDNNKEDNHIIRINESSVAITESKEYDSYHDQLYLVEYSIKEMSTEERNKLPDSAFGISSKRKYPLDTEAHTRSAIKFFNYCDEEDEKELAENIIKAMKKFNIIDIKISDKNRFSKYYKSINESKKKILNDKGEQVPEKCPKCGADVKIYIKGEPVYLCSNEKCAKYFGTVPFVKEDTAATNVMVGTTTPIYVNRMQNMTFNKKENKKYAICKQYMTDLVLMDDDEVESLEDFMEYATDIHMYKIGDSITESTVNDYYTEVYPYSNTLTDIRESFESTLLGGYNQLGIESVPIFTLNESMENTNIRYYRDLNGVFIKNIDTGFRSKSFDDEKDITDELKQLVSRSAI